MTTPDMNARICDLLREVKGSAADIATKRYAAARIEELERQVTDAKADSERLEWIIAHAALIFTSKRCMSRRGGLSSDNLEEVWIVSWDEPDGSQIEQSPDARHTTPRAAIDAARALRP